jgi:hypothetical protein
MQGIPFALKSFAAGLGLMDIGIFHGHYTLMILHWLT